MRQKTLALYIRLSKEDDDVGISSEKEESNSITNQRMLLYDYLKSHPEFQDYRTVEPRRVLDYVSVSNANGNNVDAEQEAMELLRVQLNYILLTQMENFQFAQVTNLLTR